MRVALMTNIPQQSIMTEVKDVMHGDGQIDHAEIRRKVAARLCNLVANGLANFRGQLRQLFDGELLKVGGTGDRWEELHGGVLGTCQRAAIGDPGAPLTSPRGHSEAVGKCSAVVVI